MNRSLLFAALLLFMVTSCGRRADAPQGGAVPCSEALMAYAEAYPESEPQDLYKLVFQDLYGPGHLLSDSATCAAYIGREVAAMADSTAMPPYEYTLCDGRFVRINLDLVARGIIGVGALTSAVMRSAEGLPSPDARFVLSHSDRFRAAYRPHYRIVRADIFENELLPLITK